MPEQPTSVVSVGQTGGVGGATVVPGWGLVAALVVLVALTVGVAAVARLGTARASVRAALRATVQLAAVSVVIVAVVRSLWWSAGFVVLMVVIASFTAGRRVTGARTAGWAAAPVVAGVVPVLLVVLVSGTVPPVGIAVVPVAGIVIGGAMSATALAGRRAVDELRSRHGEYEAGLALGLLPRDAALEIVRPTAASALVPPLDQTRTVGLVTLPGAFVGVLIGSGDPVRAGAAQLLVLIGLLAAESIAVVLTVELVARGRLRRSTVDDGARRTRRRADR